MPSATALRQQIESSLATRIPGALSVRFQQPPELIATGIQELDALLRGGLPLGGLSEITGPACSGKTTLVSSLIAGVTRQGGACAYVDVADAFDPLSAAALGVNLGRLLWVRARRTVERVGKEGWARLDQALRATDLLLNAGGFRVIVLDMGGALENAQADQARRVPLATWYRYRLQAEKTQALFLLLTQTPCAKSCASVVLHCADAQERWEPASKPNALPLLTGFDFNVSADRRRGAVLEVDPFGKKPSAAVETPWHRSTQWTRQ